MTNMEARKKLRKKMCEGMLLKRQKKEKTQEF